MIYRTNFERINFCFDPPVRQSLDIVFESDITQDEDHAQEMIDAAYDALYEQYPSWKEVATPFPVSGYSGWSSTLGGREIEEVVDKDLNFDLGEPGDSPIPRIAEVFKKKGWENEKFSTDRDRKWRVSGFYKTWVKPIIDNSNLSKKLQEQVRLSDEILNDILAEERANMSPEELERKEREIEIIPCSREEAEFVSGVGVAGIILRVEDVEITGRVSWDDRAIARARRDYKPDQRVYPTMWYKYW